MIRKVFFVDSGTTYGMGGWQISRAAFDGLRALGVQAEYYPLSARIRTILTAFKALEKAGGGGCPCDEEIMEWACGTLVEKAVLFKPDLLVAMKGTRITERALSALRAAGITTAAWTMDDPYELEHYLFWAPYYDYVFTNEPRCLPFYSSCGGPRPLLLAHAHNPAVHRPAAGAADSPEYSSDICFIGASYPGRVALLKAIAPCLARHKSVVIGDWKAHAAELPGVRVIDGFMPETEAVKYYSGAKIVINMHRLPSERPGRVLNAERVGADGINSRTFEIAGTGAFQLVDSSRSLLKEYFEPGVEIETFSGPEDLGAKIERYLGDPARRLAISSAGRRRALAEHTYAGRMAEMLKKAEAAEPELARI